MKSTGFARRVDKLRKIFKIPIKDSLEIYVHGEQIILKKYEPACVFHSNAMDIVNNK